MNRLCLGLSSLLLAATLFSCGKKDPGGESLSEQVQLPNTPEDVVRQYQGYIDRNDFAAAKLLSTPEEQVRLSEMATMFAGEVGDSTLLTTEFLNLVCTPRQDSAFCSCTLKDQYETYETQYLLLRINKQWLVHIPQESELLFDDEELEYTMDSLINVLERQLQ
ncbi:MAG: hypothetical protein H6555_03700 [Lewinellaceae bacterium]|nr:hypothetical protein [Lewinellaceae bacterium]